VVHSEVAKEELEKKSDLKHQRANDTVARSGSEKKTDRSDDDESDA
jgi:hypothetical protein